MAYPVIQRTSDFLPSFETIAARYLKLVKVPSFCFYLFPLALFGLLSTYLHFIPSAGFADTSSTLTVIKNKMHHDMFIIIIIIIIIIIM